MPTESTYPRISQEFPDIWKILFERKTDFPEDKVIYSDCDTGRTYTYAQVKNTAIEFGEGLKANWEWKKGDVLALYTPNSIDTPAITWGTLWAGGIVSPANPGYTVEELAFQLKDCGAKALATQLPLLDVATKAAKQVGIPEDRIILLGDAKDPLRKYEHFQSIRNLSQISRFRRSKIDPKEDLAFLVYSSGTTGHPKGVMLSHQNISSNILQQIVGDGDYLHWKGVDGKGDRVMAFLPFFHIYGLTCMVHLALYSGYELVVMSKFDLEKLCSIIEQRKITFLYAVPPVILQLSKTALISKYNLSSIRMVLSGAAPLTKELVSAFYGRLKLPVKQGYGMSETSPTTHMQRWDDCMKYVGSVGRLLPNITAKYMSHDEKELPVGETGELWVKGPNIFKGYLNNPAGTKNALTSDGYFRTGDVGYQDAEGNFYITDRIKELIKYKGFQVPPAELEGILISHPDIDDVAVIGVYSKEQATELPRAYVVPKKGIEAGKALEKNVVDWLAGKVANHKRLRGGVRFVDVVPKSVSGKILRRVLQLQAVEEEKGAKAIL